MGRTIGYHIVVSGYGLWLPGDDRGSWSSAWDEEIGFIEPHALHPGDPIRLRMAQERAAHSPVRLSSAMIDAVAASVGLCEAESDWSVVAASIEMTHTHLLLTYTEREIGTTIKWIKDRVTKAVHRDTRHTGPVWCKGRWCSFVFDRDAWDGAKTYIERHNVRRGVGPKPYPFIDAD